jgi:hypothetical protein
MVMPTTIIRKSVLLICLFPNFFGKEIVMHFKQQADAKTLTLSILKADRLQTR